MPSFDELFSESKGRPVIYQGQALWQFDRLAIRDGQTLTVKFESVSSDWRQGIRLDFDVGFEIDGNCFKKKALLLWPERRLY